MSLDFWAIPAVTYNNIESLYRLDAVNLMKWFMEAYNNRPQSGPQDFRPTLSIPAQTPMTNSRNSK
jgi:hypothetical protein